MIMTISAILIAAGVVSTAIKNFAEKRSQRKADETVTELEQIDYRNPRQALQALKETPGISPEKRKSIARFQVSALLGDLLTKYPTTLKEAISAESNFATRIKEAEIWRNTFVLQEEDVYPVSLAEMKSRHLKLQLVMLNRSLEHYPGKPWLEIPASKVFMTLLEYSGGFISAKKFNLWRSWLWKAWINEAKYELRLLRRHHHWTEVESSAGVDKILRLLRLAHAGPEDIETSTKELKKLRKVHKQTRGIKK